MIFNLATLVIAFMAFTASAQMPLPTPRELVILYTDGNCTISQANIAKEYFPHDIGDSGCVSNCLPVGLNAHSIEVYHSAVAERTTCYIWQDENHQENSKLLNYA